MRPDFEGKKNDRNDPVICRKSSGFAQPGLTESVFAGASALTRVLSYACFASGEIA